MGRGGRRAAHFGGRELLDGHSARNWLPSAAASCEVPPDRVDYLGRWRIKAGVAEYVRTARQVVLAVQRTVARATRSDPACLDEQEVLDKLAGYLRERNVEEEVIAPLVSAAPELTLRAKSRPIGARTQITTIASASTSQTCSSG